MRESWTRLFNYYKLGFIFDFKSILAYPTSFWFAATTVPFWSLLQILFIETIYGQTESFVGYTKYENYVLLGTFKLVQSIAVFLFLVRLEDLPEKVRGTDDWSLDMMLIKPIDFQIFATTGKFWFGAITSMMAGISMVFYGLRQEPHLVNIGQLITYGAAIWLGVLLLYLVFLFIQTWLFWFEYLQIGEELWFNVQDFGQYPKGLYRGWLGIIFNIGLPMTLMGAVPVDMLFGRMSPLLIAMYAGVVAVLIYLTRVFWQYSIKKYSSFSS